MAVRFETHVEPIPGYRLIDRLGSGGFGEVWKCEAPGGIFKAVKIIHGDLRSKDNDLVRYAEQELKAMKRVKAVRHPYLLAIDRYDIVEGRLLIVMELADCNLWDRFRQCRLNGLTGIAREDLLLYMQEAAEVLDLMNFEHQLMHLDIKPQNIFLQYNHVKVGDFGQVKDLEGIMASVTGGITPVYAAPETFDGVVTRYCDQYSLACVYQELLTGQRPFDGGSMQQLLMQHLTAAPNLSPSPPSDRPALAKALSKKPEDRFANCLELVKALRGTVPVTMPVEEPAAAPLNQTRPWVTKPTANVNAFVETLGNTSGSSVINFVTTGIATTPLPVSLGEADTPQEAPPEEVGPGTIRPALVIGLGGTGLRFLQRFRKQVADHHGSMDAVPAVRTLFIDTDPDTLAAAATDRTLEGIGALKPEEIFSARLNRSAHYLKPRQTGRSLVEGWFDPALLHRLPRNPVTLGIRAFGRLALCDHYRPLMQKIEADLESCLTPEALAETLQTTGQPLGSNRPRIYIASALAGGTGGGMVIDLAYIIRNRLRRLGYSCADVVGLLFIPPDDPEAEIPPQVRANVVAALTELNHYSRPRSSFHSFYDDRHAYIRDPEPPFARLLLMPSPLEQLAPLSTLVSNTPARITWSDGRNSTMKMKELKDIAAAVARSAAIRQSSSGTQRHALLALADDPNSMQTDHPVQNAADWLRLDLFSNLSQVCDSMRPPAPPIDVPTVASTWGMVRFEWPRNEIVGRTARILSGVLLDQWVSPDTGRARDAIPAWTATLWQKLSLDLEGFIERLRHAADTTMQMPCDTLLTQMGDVAQAKGWLNRTPDAAQVGHVLIQWDQLVGNPLAGINREATLLEESLRITAADAGTAAQAEITSAVPKLIDDPKYRLAGAEEAARQILSDLSKMASAMGNQADALDAEAVASHKLLSAHAHGARGQSTLLADALKHYPQARYKAILARRAARTYAALRDSTVSIKNDMANCRQRLDTFRTALRGEMEQPSPSPGLRTVMPPGCMTIEEAAKRYLEVLNDDDLHHAEAWVQGSIDRTFGGLYQACLNTAEGATGLLGILRTQCKAYLNTRLGEVDLAAMFEQKYGPPQQVVEAFREACSDAQPSLLNAGPWSRGAISVFAAPAGESGELLRHAAFEALPDAGTLLFANTPDECVIYCEYPQVPLAALPHFGPAWQAAYENAYEMLQCTPHTRTDVTEWIGIDS